MSNPCKNKPCGCEDQPLKTPVPCTQDTPDCPNPDPCSETFSECCVIHTIDTIVDLPIQNGDNLCTILQALVIFMTNSGCMDPNGTCLSPLNFKSVKITGTTIKVSWNSSAPAINYQVEYKEATSLIWILNPVLPVTSLSDTISGLNLNTDYHIRVGAICASGTCYSVTILVKTKTV